ncbi:glycosyltransferase family 4 protein [Sphingomonas bacterium]|uniref:glycosyltransferase family 4 protein n=1 Tax=Sphingomonas bacterium TaxID=1895847 RepID=UPI001576ED11|nr:glycosyltransferase family 1 protein [Sphingomonas bacterium]
MPERPTSSGEPEIILDLSRLLSRVPHATPTGVDRCEMAYARGLLAAVPDRLRFAAVHPSGIYGRIPHGAVLRFLDATEERWDHKGFGSIWEMRRFAARAMAAMRPRSVRRDASAPRPCYVQASPNNLTKPALVQSILKRERARFFCLVHDLIPLQYPEYARPGGAAEHEVRVRTILSSTDGVICNSHATLDALRPWMDRLGRHPSAVVAHIGTHLHRIHDDTPLPAYVTDGRPYFVCIGTIEPRKNHLLLLNLWRRMAEERGAANIPRLIIVGRRGWENEQVIDMLERCPALQGCVEEKGRLSDREVVALLPGARALLMPSFAEGYGMPIAEALSLRVPVVCSDLPALREAGAAAPVFLDPLDGPAWQSTVLALEEADGDLSKQLRDRTSTWNAPSWRDHIAILLGLLHRAEQ